MDGCQREGIGTNVTSHAAVRMAMKTDATMDPQTEPISESRESLSKAARPPFSRFFTRFDILTASIRSLQRFVSRFYVYCWKVSCG